MFGLFKKKAKAERRYDVTRIQYELGDDANLLI